MARTRNRGTAASGSFAFSKSLAEETKATAPRAKNSKPPVTKGAKKGTIKTVDIHKRHSNGRPKQGPGTTTKAANRPADLPPCPGPKLQVFKHHSSRIEWLERLDEDRDEYSGLQGYVFRVRIESKQYALKIFKNFDIESKRYYWDQYLHLKQAPEVVAHYMDPFFCECRAYGQIQKALKDNALKTNPALPCYGYLFLKEEDEQLLESRGIDLGSNSSDSEDEHSLTPRQPIRALVKKLASSKSGVTVRSQGKLYVDILELNKLGVYNRDIRADNYRGGSLVDFGSSITKPNIILEALSKAKKEEIYRQDELMFKTMLEDEGIPLRIDTLAHKARRRSSRSRVQGSESQE